MNNRIPTRILLIPLLALGTACTARLNEVVTRLPATPEYSRRMNTYTVQEVVEAAKHRYQKVVVTGRTVEISDQTKLSPGSNRGLKPSSIDLTLQHNGTRLTGDYTNVTKYSDVSLIR